MSLRADARWHDGRPVTTEDVRATLANSQSNAGGIQIKVVNRLQCRLRYQSDQTTLMEGLSQLAILPAHLPMDGTHAVGSGPFRYVDTAGKASIFGAHAGWHGGQVKLRSVILHVIPAAKSRAEALASGKIDAAMISSSDLPLLADARAFRKYAVVPGGLSPNATLNPEHSLVVSTYVEPLAESSVASDWAWVRRLAHVDYEGR